MIDDYGDGAIHLDHYRGRSVLGFYEQAAEFFVRRELGLAAIDAVTWQSGVSPSDRGDSSSTSRRAVSSGPSWSTSPER